MIFTQLVFLLFFIVTFCVHWLLKGNQARKIWLLATSCFFYGYWDARFLLLIFFSIVVDYFTARALSGENRQRVRKLLITGSICVNLGILGFFKYYNFFADSTFALLQALGFHVDAPTLRIVLPVGVSFFTFQSMTYTVDVYRRQLEARKSFLDFSLYVTFFPQLVAGPIVRAIDFLPQLDTPRVWRLIDGRRALLLFTIGYFKKACLADNIAHAIDPLFASPLGFDGPSRVLGAVLYSAQIYCDFSGYTDMAIAVACVFGYELTRNFDAPYLSKNIQEFWQRWHISLSTWLRDYLYIPLGGNRGGAFKVYRNLMLTMLLGGLWHGANWTFILWGALHGAALALHRWASRRAWGFSLGRVGTTFGWLLTLTWVVMCFTIFRTPNIQVSWDYFFGSTLSQSQRLWTGWWLVVAAAGVAQWLYHQKRSAVVAWAHGLPDWLFYPGLGAVTSLLLLFTPQDLTAFIYFQF